MHSVLQLKTILAFQLISYKFLLILILNRLLLLLSKRFFIFSKHIYILEFSSLIDLFSPGQTLFFILLLAGNPFLPPLVENSLIDIISPFSQRKENKIVLGHFQLPPFSFQKIMIVPSRQYNLLIRLSNSEQVYNVPVFL